MLKTKLTIKAIVLIISITIISTGTAAIPMITAYGEKAQHKIIPEGTNVYHLPYQSFYWIGVPDPRELNSVDEIPEGLTLFADFDVDPRKGEVKYNYMRAFEKCPYDTWEGSLIGYGMVGGKVFPNGFSYMSNKEIIEEIKKDREATTASFRKTPLKERLRAATEAEIKAMAGKFKDVGNHWAKDYIGKLALLGIIAGYGDGRFGPEDTLKVDEFLKMVLRGMGHVVEEGDKYWAEPYIILAKQEGIIEENEFTDYRRPIRREEAARIVIKAVLTDEYAPPENHYNYVKRKIPDYMEIGDPYKQYVLYSYCFGIITGAGNNIFMPKKNLTRAEGSAIIIRALDECERKPLKPTESEVIIQGGWFSRVIYPPLKPELMDFIRAVKAVEEKNKASVAGFGSDDYQTGTGITFYDGEKERGILSMAASISASMDEWSLTNGYDYYNIAVWHPDKVKELHMDSFREIFNFFFGKEADKAMKEFEYFLNLNDGRELVKIMEINGRYFRLGKDAGSIGFGGGVKIK